MPKSTVIKWPGGKGYLAKKIISLMPSHLHYVEPYAGGLSVLLNKDPEGVSEVVNDKNHWLTNFWCVLQDEKCFSQFKKAVEVIPFSEYEWEHSREQMDLYEMLAGSKENLGVTRAVWFFVCCRQSLAGRMKSFTGITKTRTRRGMNNEVSAWLSAVEGLPQVHQRLKRVLVLNRDALDVIKGQDGSNTLFYLDPPYPHETRATTTEYGEYEMSEEDHQKLLDVLRGVQGSFLLSGYRSKLYDAVAKQEGWRREDIEIANHAAGGKEKRRMVESIWLNY